MRWINRTPRSPRLLGVVPFAAIAVVYLAASAVRLAENPDDKLMPALTSMGEAWSRLALAPDARSGRYLFWDDTLASLARMGTGLAITTATALVTGMAMGMFPHVRALFAASVTAASMIPALAVLPILFIVFGVGEVSKIALLVVGLLPFMVRDLWQRVSEIPEEQWIKAQTLGASSFQLALRVILPQTVPRLIDSVRLSLGPAWLFLISAEAISATSGLGYRVFLVRRYLAMDIILPYVAWITLLAFAMDSGLRALRRRHSPWLEALVAR
jgi:NitT/TauT family transport system permease protein